jgi:hypothetical protein
MVILTQRTLEIKEDNLLIQMESHTCSVALPFENPFLDFVFLIGIKSRR